MLENFTVSQRIEKEGEDVTIEECIHMLRYEGDA